MDLLGPYSNNALGDDNRSGLFHSWLRLPFVSAIEHPDSMSTNECTMCCLQYPLALLSLTPWSSFDLLL
eukprot:3736204-Amphidinium_carterae.1